MSFIFLFEIINVVTPDPNNLLCITASVAVAAAINSNDIKTLSVNCLNTLLIKGNPVFSNGPKSWTKNLPECPILGNWLFDNFILAEELFVKAFCSLETWVLVKNNLWAQLVS